MLTVCAKAGLRVLGLLGVFLLLGTPNRCKGQERQPTESATSSTPDGGESEGTAGPPSALKGVDPDKDSGRPFRRDITRMGKDFLFDQKQIWTSPEKIRPADTTWLVPILGITAGLIQTDGTYSMHLPQGSKTTSRYNTLSNAGL